MSPPDAARPASKRRLLLPAAGLLVLHALLSLAGITRTGMAFDEPAHLAGGFAALSTGDYRLSDTSWLPGRWAALPLVAMGVEPSLEDSGGWSRAEVFHYGFDLLGTDLGSARRLLVAGRVMILILSLAGAVLVFVIARRVHGDAGALVSLALSCLSPALLAHSGLVTADLASALALLAGTWTTWLLLERVTLLRLLAGCVAVSVALLVKASTLLLLPVAVLLVVVQLIRRDPWPVGEKDSERLVSGASRAGVLAVVVLAHALAGWFGVWAFWGFRAEATTDPAAAALLETRWDTAVAGSGATGRVLSSAWDSGLLPEAWLQAVAHVSGHARRAAFLRGLVSEDGFTTFMPQVFLRKTTLAAFGLLLLALFAPRPRDTWPFWILVFAYFASAMVTQLSIGHRHLLPVYPALFVIAGGAAAWLRDERSWRRCLTPALLGLLAVETFVAAPRFLSYFNPIGGGEREAWRQLVDSSLDWGQDLPTLARWLETNAGDEAVYLSYFGTDDPLSHGIEAAELHSFHPWTYRHGRARGFLLDEGLYVFSATMYQGLHASPLPPWNVGAEVEFRALRALIDPAFDAATPRDQVALLTGDGRWRERYIDLHELRFVRLREWLRLNRPEPDEQPAPSFLAWRLSRADIAAALHGPPPLDPADD